MSTSIEAPSVTVPMDTEAARLLVSAVLWQMLESENACYIDATPLITHLVDGDPHSHLVAYHLQVDRARVLEATIETVLQPGATEATVPMSLEQLIEVIRELIEHLRGEAAICGPDEMLRLVTVAQGGYEYLASLGVDGQVAA